MAEGRGLRRFLRDLVLGAPDEPPAPAPAVVQPPAPRPTDPPKDAGPDQDGHAYLARLRAKMEHTAQDFAAGTINRSQFEKLYSHYQSERASVELLLQAYPEGDAWRSAVTDGYSVTIRNRHRSRLVAYAVYDNQSSVPLYTQGDFGMESELVVGMLSGFRSASAEIFGTSVRKTEVEDGKALYFVPGRHSTLLALYTSEPAVGTLKLLEEVHLDFETANGEILARGSPDPSQLVFLHRSALE
ncbi:MAG: hypothetical protein ACE5NC_00190 [Anaerolineae bacterium]